MTMAVSSSTTTKYTAIGGCFITDDLTIPYTTSVQIMAAKRGAYRTIVAGDNRAKKIKMNFSTKKNFNVRDVKDNLTRLGATIAANPTELSYFNVWLQGLDVQTVSVNLIVHIDYIVLFSEPTEMAPSTV